MGCVSSAAVRPQCASAGAVKESGALTISQHLAAHDRLRKLRQLDEATKVPFILVELRGVGHRDGYIEICGKDEYGVYEALDEFLTKTWRCTKLDAGDSDDTTPLPFCDGLYRWSDFRAEGSTGQSNMGLATMQLVDFMTNKLCWTLGVINGGNVGACGEIREQQIIFKAPHPMNMVAAHVMVELRSAGYIQVCGNNCVILDDLEKYFVKEFAAKPVRCCEAYCDRYYKCGRQFFREQGTEGENNLGLLTTKVCDELVKIPGWSLVTINGGNYGEAGTHREQQLVFRWDNHPLGDQPHLLVELRDAGYVEINGQNVGGIYQKLTSHLKQSWACSESGNSGSPLGPLCDYRLRWKPKDMMLASAEITGYFHEHGWQMQACSQGTVKVAGRADSREQQILFRPGSSGLGVLEPHLFIELYTGEGEAALYADASVTQVLKNQHIRVCPVGDCGGAVYELHNFVVQYLGGSPGKDRYNCDVFMSRGVSDNNLGCWTMRVCDFMVDRLGWSFVVCNVCNTGSHGQHREQQLVFRYDGERRQIPVNKVANNSKTRPENVCKCPLPAYWSIPDVLQSKKSRAISACNANELSALQEIVDFTFKRALTRDRVYEYQMHTREEMPYRLEVVHAFRSENLNLYLKFADRRRQYKGGTPVAAKTRGAGSLLVSRMGEGESLLFHGTNPSSAIGILKTGFCVNNAGKSTGTMFGNGVYLAEASSKADEYACDDSGGTYQRLNALLVCRSLIGDPYIVQDAGDHVGTAKQCGYDCVLGDRESKVGTYREFVFFDERQVLPEYVIIYRREYDQAKVPLVMRCPTSGTTGRNWQVRTERGWSQIPRCANQEILVAQEAGQTKCSVQIGGIKYMFDFEALTQTNTTSGTVRQIRPPTFGSRSSSSFLRVDSKLSDLPVGRAASIVSIGSTTVSSPTAKSPSSGSSLRSSRSSLAFVASPR